MMNLILVKREGTRRRAGGRRRCLPGAEGTVRGRQGQQGQEECLTFRGTGNRAQSSGGHGPRETRGCPPSCPLSSGERRPASLPSLPGERVSAAVHGTAWLHLPARLALALAGRVPWPLMSNRSTSQMHQLRLENSPKAAVLGATNSHLLLSMSLGASLGTSGR